MNSNSILFWVKVFRQQRKSFVLNSTNMLFEKLYISISKRKIYLYAKIKNLKYSNSFTLREKKLEV